MNNPSNKELSLLCLGDSYTIGESVPLHEGFPYQTIQKLRKAGWSFAPAEVVAKTGWTTFELMAHLDKTILNNHYNFVTLLIGVNNQYRGLSIADFEKDLSFLQFGMNTQVGEAGSTLSGGQKQRLSIARALIKNPEILILDDSLSAVDAQTEDTIIQHLKNYRQGKTNIIVAHRFSAVRDADLILVLEGGSITQSGTHQELLRVDGWYKRQYIQQMTMR